MEDTLSNVVIFASIQDIIANMHINKMFNKLCRNQIIWKLLVAKKYATKFYVKSWYNTYRICYTLMGIMYWPGSFDELLRVHHIYINTIPNDIQYLTSLETLHSSNNKLTVLPTEVWQLTTLQKLYVNNNRLAVIPPNIGTLVNLHHINLSYNTIACIPDELYNIVKLQALRISRNNITHISSCISKLVNLRELDLSHNKITTIPTTIGHLSNLQVLQLCNNNITHLPNDISRLKLTVCTIKNNLGIRVPKTLYHLVKYDVQGNLVWRNEM
jgi:Leucine-rich repeat (LRR) protein